MRQNFNARAALLSILKVSILSLALRNFKVAEFTVEIKFIRDKSTHRDINFLIK